MHKLNACVIETVAKPANYLLVKAVWWRLSQMLVNVAQHTHVSATPVDVHLALPLALAASSLLPPAKRVLVARLRNANVM